MCSKKISKIPIFCSKKCNKIGLELAQSLWEDKYQVLVCTHINKDNIHNHKVLNSVIDKINTKIQTCKRIILKAEKGEKEDKLIQKRSKENQLKNEKENNKNKKLDRAF